MESIVALPSVWGTHYLFWQEYYKNNNKGEHGGCIRLSAFSSQVGLCESETNI